MPYNIIADLGEYTTQLNVGNRCNLLTIDNEIMLCEDLMIENYAANSPLLTLSNSMMIPNYKLQLPISIINYRTNLLQNSEHYDITSAPFNNSTVVKVNNTKFDGETYYYCNFNQNRYVQVDFPTLEIGKDYWFSFEVARTPEATSQIIQHEIFIDGNTYYGGGLNNGIWKTTLVKFTATATSTNATIKLGYASQTTNNGGYFRHFMLIKEDYDKWFSGTDVAFNELSIININTDGSLSLPFDFNKAKICLNGFVWQNSEKFYNHTIGNVNVTPSSPYQSRM